MPLKGDQLSLLPEVSPYLIENPPLLGEWMVTRSGVAIVTRLESLGEEVVIWGDYGSGVEQPHGRENATCDLKIVLGGSAVCQVPIADTLLVIDSLGLDFAPEEIVLGGSVGYFEESDPLAPKSNEEAADYSAEPPLEKTVLGGEDTDSASADPLAPKFETKACGWIGWKTTERKRKKRDPWICRQAWLYWEEPGGKKRSRYIPKAKLADVEHSVYGLKRPIYETLEILEKK